MEKNLEKILEEEKIRNEMGHIFNIFTGKIDINFETPRFNKYKNKCEELCFDYIKKIYPNKGLNLKEFCVGAIASFLYNEFVSEKKDEVNRTFFTIIENYESIFSTSDNSSQIENRKELSFFNKETLEVFLSQVSWNLPFGLYYIYETSFVKACKRNLYKRASDLLEKREVNIIDSSNYFLTLPKNEVDFLQIIKDTLNIMYIEVLLLFKEKSSFEISQKTKELNYDNAYKNAYDDFSSHIEEMIPKVYKKFEKEFNEQKEELEKLKKIQNKEELLEEELEVFSRKNEKLKIRYNNLVEKFKRLKENIKDENSLEDDEEIEELKEIDYNLKYVFLVSDEITFKDNLTETFPNAKLISKSTNLDPNSIDCIIAITSHLGHSEYYGIKEQCKNKNIPFCHCSFSNIELIKELIYNTLYL